MGGVSAAPPRTAADLRVPPLRRPLQTWAGDPPSRRTHSTYTPRVCLTFNSDVTVFRRISGLRTDARQDEDQSVRSECLTVSLSLTSPGTVPTVRQRKRCRAPTLPVPQQLGTSTLACPRGAGRREVPSRTESECSPEAPSPAWACGWERHGASPCRPHLRQATAAPLGWPQHKVAGWRGAAP